MTNTQGASAPIVFTFRTTEVRTVVRDGEVWFVASDVAKALGYPAAKDMTRVLDDDEKDGQIVPTLGGDQEMTVISESGLYHAVLKSRKPEAKPFRKWVTSEVLPAIRKTGRYEAQQPAISERHAEAARANGRKGGRPPREVSVPPGNRLANSRWLVSFDPEGRQQITSVPADAYVMTIPRLLTAINESNGRFIDTATLTEFAVAAIRRLQRRCEFYEGRVA